MYAETHIRGKQMSKRQEIISFFEKHNLNPNTIRNFLIKHPEIKNLCTKIIQRYPEYQNEIRLIKCIVLGIKLRRCIVCGKTLTYKSSISGISCCSYKCSLKIQSEKRKNLSDEEKTLILHKRRMTSLKHYGTSHPMQASCIKEKVKDTILKKHKQQIVSSDKQNKKSKKDEQNSKKLTKTQQYKLDTFGTLSPTSEQLLKIRRQHCLEKYGYEHPMKNEEIKNKSKQTMLNHYGVESFFYSDEFKTRNFNKRNEKWKQYVVPLFKPTEFEGNAVKKIYKWKCIKCGNIFEQRIYNTNFCKLDERMPRCLHCYPLVGNGKSKEEKELYDYISSIVNCECISSFHVVKDGKYLFELDIYIPELHFAIEFDGLFWHNERSGKKSEYHLWKTKECEKMGIKLIHIFEDEWMFHKEAVKDYLRRFANILVHQMIIKKYTVCTLTGPKWT